MSLPGLGAPVALSLPRPTPDHRPLTGRHVRLEALVPAHASALFAAFTDPAGWLYLSEDRPWNGLADAQHWVQARYMSRDPLFYVVIVADAPVGFCSFLRIAPAHGVIEIGYIHFAPELKGTVAATEAQYLMMAHVFDTLGYRRYEWKCNALNAPSRRAAERLGFTFEGIFRQHQVNKGANRDTAWFSILDHEWPAQKARFKAWLSDDNFSADGQQIRRLQDCA